MHVWQIWGNWMDHLACDGSKSSCEHFYFTFILRLLWKLGMCRKRHSNLLWPRNYMSRDLKCFVLRKKSNSGIESMCLFKVDFFLFFQTYILSRERTMQICDTSQPPMQLRSLYPSHLSLASISPNPQFQHLLTNSLASLSFVTLFLCCPIILVHLQDSLSWLRPVASRSTLL